MKHKGLLIVISGFSGVGKGTLVKKLVDSYDNYALSVSMTTRAPRDGEKDGVSYFFVEKETFEENIANDGLIEYASYVGNYYGTPRAWVEEQLESGRDVVLEIEVQGALKVKEKFPEALLLFLLPPSAQELKHRLEKRGTETAEVIEQRLKRAREEAEYIGRYDFIEVNDDLDACMGRINGIVAAAHGWPSLNTETINTLKEELDALAKGEN
ncbi:MAG: guanylate kinase [Eisenbergiella sp.]